MTLLQPFPERFLPSPSLFPIPQDALAPDFALDGRRIPHKLEVHVRVDHVQLALPGLPEGVVHVPDPGPLKVLGTVAVTEDVNLSTVRLPQRPDLIVLSVQQAW